MSDKNQKTRANASGLAQVKPETKKRVNTAGGIKNASEANSGSWPVFDSIAHCSGVTGIPKDRLHDWKKEGATGFRGSRVYIGELLPWMMEKIFAPVNSERESFEPPICSWADMIDKQEFEKRAGNLVEAERIRKFLAQTLLPVRQAWIAMATQLAPKVNPTDPIHAQREIEAYSKGVMRMIVDAERAKVE